MTDKMSDNNVITLNSTKHHEKGGKIKHNQPIVQNWPNTYQNIFVRNLLTFYMSDTGLHGRPNGRTEGWTTVSTDSVTFV